MVLERATSAPATGLMAYRKCTEAASAGSRGVLFRPVSNVTAFHQTVDIALNLLLVVAVLSHDLNHDVIFVLQRHRSYSENLPHLALISLSTISLVCAAFAGFATVEFGTGLVM